MPELLKPKQLAARIGVHERTVRVWSEKGLIPYYRFGRDYRYNPDEVLAALHHDAVRLKDNRYARIGREVVPA